MFYKNLKSINKNNGALNAGATGANTNVTEMRDQGEKFGGAMEFDGTNDYVGVPDFSY